MKDLELALLPDWRFCRMDFAVKCPRYSNWQISPYLLESIPPTGNIGILTGHQSNGVLAIDFDGPFAWKYWQENIPYPLTELNTVTWSSGKPARCQMAFNVPKEIWEHIKTFKIIEPDVTDRKPDGLEFRWEGCQSVLPPSQHPDTKKPYFWIVSPADVYVQDLPLDVLDWMLSYNLPVKQEDAIEIAEVTVDTLTIDVLDETERILKKINQYEPRLGYDDWIRVTWATVSHVGTEAGIALMNSFWPEQSKNEYHKLLRGFSIAKSPKFGSLVHRAASHNTPKEAKQLIKQAFGNNRKTSQMTF